MISQNTVIIASTVLFTIGLVILAAYLLASYSSWFIRNRSKFIILIAVFGIAIYAVGYMSVGNPGHLSVTKCISSGLMAIFSMGRMFVLENDISELGSIADSPAYQIFFSVIMTFSMLTIVMVVLSFFGYRVICKSKLWFLKVFGSSKDLYIFTELNKKSLMLAEDIKKNNKKRIIIFYTDEDSWGEETNDMEKKAKEKGYILTLCNKKRLSDFCIYKRTLKRNIHFFANSQEENHNISIVKALSRCIGEAAYCHNKLTVYVFGKDIMFDSILDEYKFTGFELKLINELDLSCRHLFADFIPISCVDKNTCDFGKIKSEFNIALVGYSSLTEYVFRDLVYLSQFKELILNISIIDENIEDKMALFLNRNSELHKCAALNLVDLKPGSKGFFHYFNENHKMYSLVFVTLEDEKPSVDISLELERLYRMSDLPVRICSPITNYEKYEFLFDNHCHETIMAFGGKSDIYKEDIIINEKLDIMAKAVHYYYCKYFNYEKDWSELSLFEKQSNRALAMQIRSKLYSIGLDYTNSPNKDSSFFEDALTDTPDIANNLAEGEHLRWNAFHFVHGWRVQQLSNTVKTPSKDKNKKLHACLVDWDELAKVDKYYNKNYQEMDKHLIINIGNIVKSAGYSIIKLQ